jgi:HEAT repeat protein
MATDHQHDTLTPGVSDLRTVSTITQLMAGAIKHHTLYPEDHSIARQHIGKIFDALTTFLQTHKALHLDVGKNTLTYEGEIAYQGVSEENDLAFLLGRDGVEWLEFTRDLELWELQTLLRVINDNRRDDLNHDGNIANALWEQDFPHIEYKTIDLLAMDLPLLDLSGFRVATGSEPGEDQEAPRSNREAEWEDYYTHDSDLEEFDEDDEEIEEATLAITAPGNALWSLTDLEQYQLETMVKKAENHVDTEATIEVLFILLVLQNSEQEASDIMAFLQDRFLYCLQQHQFQHALKIVRTLKNIASADEGRYELIKPKIEEMFAALCRPESLRDLEKFFDAPDSEVGEEELQHLWKVLQLLPAEIVGPLATISGSMDIHRFGRPFLDLFKNFADQTPGRVAEAATTIHEAICLHLLTFLQQLPMQKAVPILSSLALHPSARVRGQAFAMLDRKNMVDLKGLFPLVGDPDPAISTRMLVRVAARRDPAVEQLMLDYLQECRDTTDNPDHILACYHALGKAGSRRSIPFLQDVLLHGSRLGTLFASGGGPHKEGAAQALLELRIPEARQIVKEGTSNMRPDVRSACRKALEERYG